MIEFLIKISPIVATIFFFSFFCYMIFIVFKKGSKKKFDQYSKIPMDDDKKS